MKPEDRHEMIGLIAEAFEQVMMPHINEIKSTLGDHGERLESIEHKVDSTILRVDRHSRKLKI